MSCFSSRFFPSSPLQQHYDPFSLLSPYSFPSTIIHYLPCAERAHVNLYLTSSHLFRHSCHVASRASTTLRLFHINPFFDLIVVCEGSFKHSSVLCMRVNISSADRPVWLEILKHTYIFECCQLRRRRLGKEYKESSGSVLRKKYLRVARILTFVVLGQQFPKQAKKKQKINGSKSPFGAQLSTISLFSCPTPIPPFPISPSTPHLPLCSFSNPTIPSN